MIKKVEDGYQVLAEKGKNLGGPYQTLEEAKNACARSDSSSTISPQNEAMLGRGVKLSEKEILCNLAMSSTGDVPSGTMRIGLSSGQPSKS
jgi:hypothetical protein